MTEEERVEEDEIKFCKNCFGYEPCLCNKKEYVKTWKFVYEAMLSCKPNI